jgi:hypothetical protein
LTFLNLLIRCLESEFYTAIVALSIIFRRARDTGLSFDVSYATTCPHRPKVCGVIAM